MHVIYTYSPSDMRRCRRRGPGRPFAAGLGALPRLGTSPTCRGRRLGATGPTGFRLPVCGCQAISPRHAPIAAISCRGSNGLRRQQVAPSLAAIPRKSGAGAVELANLKPDIAMMGTVGARPRRHLMVSMPSISGMKMSTITTSKSDASNVSAARRRLSAATVTQPCRQSNASIALPMDLSSSMTRTRVMLTSSGRGRRRRKKAHQLRSVRFGLRSACAHLRSRAVPHHKSEWLRQARTKYGSPHPTSVQQCTFRAEPGEYYLWQPITRAVDFERRGYPGPPAAFIAQPARLRSRGDPGQVVMQDHAQQ